MIKLNFKSEMKQQYHGDTDEMLRRQPPAYSVQASCTDILLLPHSRPHFTTVYDTAIPFPPIELSDHPTRPVTHL